MFASSTSLTAKSSSRVLARNTAVISAVVVAIGLLTALVLVAADVFLLIFAGVLLAVLLSAAADWLSERGRMRRGAALTLIILLLAVGVVGGGILLWPMLSEQFDTLARELPRAVDELRGWIQERAWGQWLLGNSQPEKMVDNGKVVDTATTALVSAISSITACLPPAAAAHHRPASATCRAPRAHGSP